MTHPDSPLDNASTVPGSTPAANAAASASAADATAAAAPAIPEATTAPAPERVDPHDELSDKERKVLADYEKNQGKVKGSFAASTWVALIIGFLLLILLIIFILQNQQSVELNFFNWTGQFSAGIAFLIFAIAGALIMALVGGWRMFELRRQVRKARKASGN